MWTDCVISLPNYHMGSNFHIKCACGYKYVGNMCMYICVHMAYCKMKCPVYFIMDYAQHIHLVIQ